MCLMFVSVDFYRHDRPSRRNQTSSCQRPAHPKENWKLFLFQSRRLQVVSLECCSHSRTDRSKVHGIASHAAQLLADGSSKLEGATFLATSKLAAKYHLDASKLAASEMLSGHQLAGGQAGDYYRVHA